MGRGDREIYLKYLSKGHNINKLFFNIFYIGFSFHDY